MSATRATIGECGIVPIERRITAVIKAQVAMNDIPSAQRAMRRRLDAALPSLATGAHGERFTLWRPSAPGMLDLEPGIIVSQAFEPAEDVTCSILPAGRAAHLLHAGSYEGIPGAWNRLLGWCAEQPLKLAGVNWEIYGEWNDDPSRLRTGLYALLA